MCTCAQDFCNSRMGALEMMARSDITHTPYTNLRKGSNNVDVYTYARADLGVTGVGRHCYQCGGRGGLCEGGAEDGGVVMDCGEGVQTCVLARNSE